MKRIFILILFMLLLVCGYLFYKSQHNSTIIKKVAIPNTSDIDTDFFTFTVSPDDNYLLYFSKTPESMNRFGYSEPGYQLHSVNLKINEKYNFNENISGVDGGAFALSFEAGCWTPDSKYCVLPSGKRDFVSPEELGRQKELYKVALQSYKNEINLPSSATWLDGILLAENKFLEKRETQITNPLSFYNYSTGQLNNSPDIIIDFSNNQPRLITQFFSVPQKKDRRTFDSLSPEGYFSCSDCGKIFNLTRDQDGFLKCSNDCNKRDQRIVKSYGKGIFGIEQLSPDGKYLMTQRGRVQQNMGDWKVYLKNISTGSEDLIAGDVSEIRWAADSKSLFISTWHDGIFRFYVK